MSKLCVRNGRILLLEMGSTGIKSWLSWGSELTCVCKGWFWGINVCLKNASFYGSKKYETQGQPTDDIKWQNELLGKWVVFPARLGVLQWLPHDSSSEHVHPGNISQTERSSGPGWGLPSTAPTQHIDEFVNELLAGVSWEGWKKKLTGKAKTSGLLVWSLSY